jgi:hypothetical protein
VPHVGGRVVRRVTTAAPIRELRAAYGRVRPRHVVVPDVIEAAAASSLRARLAGRWSTYDVADRGRFAIATTALEPELFARLCALAAAITGRALRVGTHRWTRLGHGDYALMRADAALRAAGGHIEVSLDLSPAATGEADIVYVDRGDLAVVAQVPGSLAIVGRRPSTWRFDRYLTARVGDGAVWRLRLALLPIRRPAGSGGRPTTGRDRGSRSAGRDGR